jgi:hypothetical protein
MGSSDQQFDCSNSHVAEKPWVGCGCRSQTSVPQSNFRFRCCRTPYATDMEHGSENPADPRQTVGVLAIMLASEHWPQPGPYASAAPYASDGAGPMLSIRPGTTRTLRGDAIQTATTEMTQHVTASRKASL